MIKMKMHHRSHQLTFCVDKEDKLKAFCGTEQYTNK